MKEGVEVTLTKPRTYPEIQLNSEKLTQNKQVNKSKRKGTKPSTYRRPTSDTTCPHLHNRKQEVEDRLTLDNQLVRKTHQRKSQQEPKTKNIHRANTNCSPRSERSGDYITESHRYSTTEVHTINPRGQNRAT